MKFNFKQPIFALDGQAFTNETGEEITLGAAVIKVCCIAIEGDEKLDPIEKSKVGEIAVCVHKGLELDSKQRDTAKNRVARAFANPLIVYLVNDALDHPIPTKLPKEKSHA